MDEEKPKKKRKKAAAEGDGSAKEHKRPWQEMYATVEEIKTFLADRIYLRHNVVTGRTECRVPERDWFGDDGSQKRIYVRPVVQTELPFDDPAPR
jgi:hypothetical protein